MSIKRSTKSVFKNINTKHSSSDLGKLVTNFYRDNKNKINDIVLESVSNCSEEVDEYIKGSYEFLSSFTLKDLDNFNISESIQEEIREQLSDINFNTFPFLLADSTDEDIYKFVDYFFTIFKVSGVDFRNSLHKEFYDDFKVLTPEIITMLFKDYKTKFAINFKNSISVDNLKEYFLVNIYKTTLNKKSTAKYYNSFISQILNNALKLSKDGLKLISDDTFEVFSEVDRKLDYYSVYIYINTFLNMYADKLTYELEFLDKTLRASLADTLNYCDSDFILDFSIDEQQLNVIDNWRELSSLAEDNGFYLVRQTGDHGIFRNDFGEIAIIPQGRPIGKGLSLKIQKQILKG